MSSMAQTLLTPEDLAAQKGTTGINVRRAARKFRGTPYAFGQFLPSRGEGGRGRWIFTEEDLDLYDRLPEDKRERNGDKVKKVQVVLPERLLLEVDAQASNRSRVVREGLELWLKREKRRAKK